MLRPVVVLSALLALVIPASAGAAAGPAGKADAAQAQYGVPDQGQVLPETASGGSGTPGGPSGGAGGAVSPGSGSGSVPGTQAPTQVEAGAPKAAAVTGGGLPFTGGATIPTLVAGIVALGAGLVLRRRSA